MLFEKQIRDLDNDYKEFMKLETFPVYELKTKEVSISVADAQGFDSVATASFQPNSHIHTLTISTNLLLHKHVIFHEFTHILDSERYVKGDKVRYAELSGYTEYHASQVELALLLGAYSIDEVPAFSMDTTIQTISGEKRVEQYIREKQKHAIELFGRADFPANINMLKSALGVLYNYFGLRSICEMYSWNYTEVVDNTIFLKNIPTQNFCVINNLMHGWLDEEKIELSMRVYLNTIFFIIERCRLT